MKLAGIISSVSKKISYNIVAVSVHHILFATTFIIALAIVLIALYSLYRFIAYFYVSHRYNDDITSIVSYITVSFTVAFANIIKSKTDINLVMFAIILNVIFACARYSYDKAKYYCYEYDY